MNAGEDVRLAGVARELGAWWRALAALAALGALVGFLLSFVLSPGQQASSKVVLHGQLDKNQLLTQTQIATSLAVLDPVATALGGTGVELRDRVSAEVLDGNVLRITGTGPTAEEARALTDQVANGYVRFSAQVVAQTKDAAEAAVAQRREAAQRNLDDLKAQMAQAQRAQGDPLDGAAQIAHLDVVAKMERVLEQEEHAGQDVGDRGLRTKADCQPDDAGAGEEGADLHAQCRQGHHRGHGHDDDEGEVPQDRKKRSQPRPSLSICRVRFL